MEPKAPDYGPLVFSLPSLSRTSGKKVINFFHKDMTSHTFIAGAPGCGKSQILLRLLTQLFRRVAGGSSEIVILTDSGGEFLRKFYNEKHCIVLNPFDVRSVCWNLFGELEDVTVDAKMLAESLVAEDPNPKNRWVTDGARTLLASALFAVRKKIAEKSLQSDTNPQKLLVSILRDATKDELVFDLVGTPAMALLKGKETEGLSVMRGALSVVLESLSAIADSTGEPFSVRKWVRNLVTGEKPEKRVLFIPYTDNQAPILKTVIATWLNLITNELLSLGSSRDRLFWAICDELDSLGKIDTLEKLLARGRKYGFAFTGVIQSMGQLRNTYGRDVANTIVSCTNTKIVMKQGSYEDADFWSKDIGDAEKKKRNQGVSMGQSGLSMSSNSSTAREMTVPSSVFRQLETFGAFILKISSPGEIVRYRSSEALDLADVTESFLPIPRRTFDSEYGPKSGEDVEEVEDLGHDSDDSDGEGWFVPASPAPAPMDDYRQARDSGTMAAEPEPETVETAPAPAPAIPAWLQEGDDEFWKRP